MIKNSSKAALRKKLNKLLRRHARVRVNGERASDLTVKTRTAVVHTCFNNLRALGNKIIEPQNLRQVHVEKLCRYWYDSKLCVSTMKSRLSVLRVFATWIDKKGMILRLEEYLPDVASELLKVQKVATTSKSWNENGIDVTAKLEEACKLDERFGLMLHMQLEFGLRRKEALGLKPHACDKGDYLRLEVTKNGRPRDIRINTKRQRDLLDKVKEVVHPGEHLGWIATKKGEESSLKYSNYRYTQCMKKIGITKKDAGVTGHGLRFQFAEKQAAMAQLIPATLGGDAGQMTREKRIPILAEIAEQLGHSRISVTSSYLGSCANNRSKAGAKAITRIT